MRAGKPSVLYAVLFNHPKRNRGKAPLASRPAATGAYRLLWAVRTCIFFSVIYCEWTFFQRFINALEWPAVALARGGRQRVTASPRSAGKTMKPRSARLCVALFTSTRSLVLVDTAGAKDAGGSGDHSLLSRIPVARIAACDQRLHNQDWSPRAAGNGIEQSGTWNPRVELAAR